MRSRLAILCVCSLAGCASVGRDVRITLDDVDACLVLPVRGDSGELAASTARLVATARAAGVPAYEAESNGLAALTDGRTRAPRIAFVRATLHRLAVRSENLSGDVRPVATRVPAGFAWITLEWVTPDGRVTARVERDAPIGVRAANPDLDALLADAMRALLQRAAASSLVATRR